jgi:hypothetical protein
MNTIMNLLLAQGKYFIHFLSNCQLLKEDTIKGSRIQIWARGRFVSFKKLVVIEPEGLIPIIPKPTVRHDPKPAQFSSHPRAMLITVFTVALHWTLC